MDPINIRPLLVSLPQAAGDSTPFPYIKQLNYMAYHIDFYNIYSHLGAPVMLCRIYLNIHFLD
jgi:hypothetical protein